MKGMTDEAAAFWRDYSAKLGETVIKFALGRYVSGWAEFAEPLWGLALATDAGFRFHHFPHENWMAALSRVGGAGGALPTEKTLFIPKERILGVELRRERSLLKRLLVPQAPTVFLRYREGDGERVLIAELDRDADALIAALTGPATGG
jgi:hypothetical protein